MILSWHHDPHALVIVLKRIYFTNTLELKRCDKVYPQVLCCADLRLGVHIVIHRLDALKHLEGVMRNYAVDLEAVAKLNFWQVCM